MGITKCDRELLKEVRRELAVCGLPGAAEVLRVLVLCELAHENGNDFDLMKKARDESFGVLIDYPFVRKRFVYFLSREDELFFDRVARGVLLWKAAVLSDRIFPSGFEPTEHNFPRSGDYTLLALTKRFVRSALLAMNMSLNWSVRDWRKSSESRLKRNREMVVGLIDDHERFDGEFMLIEEFIDLMDVVLNENERLEDFTGLWERIGDIYKRLEPYVLAILPEPA